MKEFQERLKKGLRLRKANPVRHRLNPRIFGALLSEGGKAFPSDTTYKDRFEIHGIQEMLLFSGEKPSRKIIEMICLQKRWTEFPSLFIRRNIYSTLIIRLTCCGACSAIRQHQGNMYDNRFRRRLGSHMGLQVSETCCNLISCPNLRLNLK